MTSFEKVTSKLTAARLRRNDELEAELKQEDLERRRSQKKLVRSVGVVVVIVATAAAAAAAAAVAAAVAAAARLAGAFVTTLSTLCTNTAFDTCGWLQSAAFSVQCHCLVG